jgi:hypothetical protein
VTPGGREQRRGERKERQEKEGEKKRRKKWEIFPNLKISTEKNER